MNRSVAGPGVYGPPPTAIRADMGIVIDPTRVERRRTLSDVLRRRAGFRLWRILTAGLLTLVGLWDVLGLLIGGDSAYRSPSYDVLKLAPWGMRTYGVILGALMVTAVYAYGRHRAGDHRLLQITLALLAGWYVMWLTAISGTWVVHGEVQAWGAVGKLAFTAFVAFTLARTTPHTVPDREGATGVAGSPSSRR